MERRKTNSRKEIIKDEKIIDFSGLKKWLQNNVKLETYTPTHPNYAKFWAKTWLTIVLIAFLFGINIGGIYYSIQVNEAIQEELDNIQQFYIDNGLLYKAEMIGNAKLKYILNSTINLTNKNWST